MMEVSLMVKCVISDKAATLRSWMSEIIPKVRNVESNEFKGRRNEFKTSFRLKLMNKLES